MPAWLVPALKAVLPHVGTILQAARPMFTKPKPGANPMSPDMLERQIAEIQAAAAQNDANIRELAEQIGTMATALQESAALAEARARRLTALCVTALALSATALALVLSWPRVA